jgi:LytS/YehU family sensor histidine kinase
MLQTFFLSSKRIEAIKRESQLVNLLQKTELQALKNQLNPHFIYNSLNSINSLTITSPERAREMVGRLSDFLRYALNQDAMQLTSLDNELKYIESYLNIEVVRFGERLKFDLNSKNDIGNLQVPVMILQPLFENAVKHGAQKSNVPVKISFRTQVMENEVNLIVTNNFDKEFARIKNEGVGLENVRNRLRLLYGNGNLLSVKTENDLFVATIRLPLKFIAN